MTFDKFLFPYLEGQTEKHEGGGHDQKTHGAKGAAGGDSEAKVLESVRKLGVKHAEAFDKRAPAQIPEIVSLIREKKADTMKILDAYIQAKQKRGRELSEEELRKLGFYD